MAAQPNDQCGQVRWVRRCHHLGFHIGELSCLLGCLGEQIGAHFQHGCGVVVNGALLQLGHLHLHALLNVALNLYQVRKTSQPIKPGRFFARFDPFWVFWNPQNQHTISCRTPSQNIPLFKIPYFVVWSVVLRSHFHQICPMNEKNGLFILSIVWPAAEAKLWQ